MHVLFLNVSVYSKNVTFRGCSQFSANACSAIEKGLNGTEVQKCNQCEKKYCNDGASLTASGLLAASIAFLTTTTFLI